MYNIIYGRETFRSAAGTAAAVCVVFLTFNWKYAAMCSIVNAWERIRGL